MTLAGAYAKIAAHEEICAERYRGINGRLSMLFAALGVAIAAIIGTAGWGLNKVYDNQEQQLRELRQVAAQVQAPRPG